MNARTVLAVLGFAVLLAALYEALVVGGGALAALDLGADGPMWCKRCK